MRNPFAIYGQDEEDEEDYVPDLSDLIPESPETDEYIEHLQSRPRQDEYKSSFGRKLVGGVLGSLLGTDFGISKAPYRNAMKSWQDEGAGLKEGAEYEGKENVQKRLAGQNIFTQGRAERRLSHDVTKAHKLFMQNEEKIAMMKDDKAKAEAHRVNADEFRKKSFELNKWYKEASMNDKRQRTGMMRQRLDNSNPEKPLDANKQKNIDDQARKSVAADPRFTKFFDAAIGKFRDEDEKGNKIDDTTKLMLEAALAKAKKRVAGLKRSDYEAMAMWAEMNSDMEEEDPMNVDPELLTGDE